MQRLQLDPLTADAFRPFGDVIDADTSCERLTINDGRTARHHALAMIECLGVGAGGAISIFRADPVDEAFVLRKMERHPLGSQAFINTSGHPYAIVVAPAGALDETRIRGFLAHAGQSVNYRPGVWHHYLLALEQPSDFVVVDRIGPGDNCDEQLLETPLQLALGS